MKSMPCKIGILTVLLGLLGCADKTDPSKLAQTTLAPPANAPRGALPSFIVYQGAQAGGIARVMAVSDADNIVGSGSAEVVLSRPGIDTVFVGPLAGRRALLAERTVAPGGTRTIDALVSVGIDGEARVTWGTMAAGSAYEAVGKTVSTGDALLAELVRYGDASGTDLFAFRAGAPPALLASHATLVGVEGARMAFLAGMKTPAEIGDLGSIGIDGTGRIALGGGDGQDRVAQAVGGRVLLTLHASTEKAADVRIIGLDGGAAHNIGHPSVDERAFALVGQRIVFSRTTASGRSLVSVAQDGTDERELVPAPTGASPLGVVPGDRIIFSTSDGALGVTGVDHGPSQILDRSAGQNVRLDKVLSETLVYAGETPNGPSLRAARLDGTGVHVLFERALSLPFAAAVTGDGHVIVHVALAGQLEGSQVYSVNLDGTGLQPIGSDVAASSTTGAGAAPQRGQADQDFEAITAAGHLVLETEYEGNLQGSQLLVAAPATKAARAITEIGAIRFVGLVQ